MKDSISEIWAISPCAILKYALKSFFFTFAVQGTATGTKKTILRQIQQPDLSKIIMAITFFRSPGSSCQVRLSVRTDQVQVERHRRSRPFVNWQSVVPWYIEGTRDSHKYVASS